MKLALLLAGALMTLAPPAAADTVHDMTQRELPELIALYQDLHAHPELSLAEVHTSAKLADEARKAGYDVTEKVGGTGVVAVLRNGAGPVVLIRADMDALPVVEETGLPFASKVRATTEEGTETGVMHACGHDTHMAAWVGVLRNLAASKASWSGTVVMIGQPGEERGKGAVAMLDDGLFTRFPKPQYALAFHDSASQLAGTIGMRSGYALANVDSVDVHIRGIGGHGAYPYMTKDPIVLGAKIVMALQTLVSRETDPQDPAVVTVGAFHAGSKHNIIPEEATLLLTVRSYRPEVRQALLDGIARIAKGEAGASGFPDNAVTVTIKDEATPSTYNTEPLTGRLSALFTQRFGKERVFDVPAVMAGEDFGRFYLADKTIQSSIFWVGGVPKEKWERAQKTGEKLPSLHSAEWAPDPAAVIGTATEAMTAAALDLLKK